MNSAIRHTTTHTVGEGNANAVVACVVMGNNGAASLPEAVTVDGKPMTLAASQAQADTPTAYASVWVATNVPPGSRDVTATFKSARSGVLHVSSYFGVDPVAPVDAVGSAAAGSGQPSSSVTTVTANAWVTDCVFAGAFGDTPSAGSGQTKMVDAAQVLQRTGTSREGPVASPGSVTMDWTGFTSAANTSVSVALKPGSWAGLTLTLDGTITSSVGPGFSLIESPTAGANPVLEARDDVIVQQEASQVLTNKGLFEPVLESPVIISGQTVVTTHQSSTIVNPTINGSLSGTAILDEDAFTSNSDTKVPTQQSTKAYVDTHPGGFFMFTAPGTVVQADNYLSFDLNLNSLTEANVDLSRAPTAFTVSNIYVDIGVAPTSPNSVTVSLRKNGSPCGSPSTLRCSPASGDSTCSDTTNTCTVAAGDRLTWFTDEAGTVASGELSITGLIRK